MPQLISYSLSDTGLSRDNNEDCFLSEPALGVWAVADGMGGHEAGEVASAIVRDTLIQQLQQQHKIENAITDAHEAVIQAVNEGHGASGMGSTVVALSSQNLQYQISWVGDSRAYLWTVDGYGGRLEQLTTDHSYVQMLLKSGAISASEVDHHPDKNVITQCLGSQDISELKVDTLQREWKRQQWILLCSDGLTDEVDNAKISQLLCESITPKEASQKLVEAALKNGGHDNVTVQVIASPLNRRGSLVHLEQWLPKITSYVWLDVGFYAVALSGLAFTAYRMAM